MKWTQSQKKAIDIPVSDVIVSAAAGSGKTAVMAERIIKRLTGEEFVDIDKILVVTYTNAAASEIKERVMKKIIEKMSDSNNENLQRQLVLIGNSHFCTIHSFCLELIKKYFYKLDIDPHVKTADPSEAKILLEKSVSNVFDEYLSQNDIVFTELINSYGNGKIKNFENVITGIYNFARTMPDSEYWLSQLSAKYDGSYEDIGKCIIHYSLFALEYYRDSLSHAIEIINDTGCCVEWLPNISREASLISEAINNVTSCEELCRNLSAISFDRLQASKSAKGREYVKSKISFLRENVKKNLPNVVESILCINENALKNDRNKLVKYVNKLVECANKVSVEFDKLKRQANLIDFSDYEHLALKLLRNSDGSPSDVAKEVSKEFEEIYIDEYQDCNNIQNAIFKYISGGIYGRHNMFCVGDMKQSIYKFRDANPLNFKEKCDYSKEYDGVTVNNSNKIFLNSNFRSRETILNFVNTTFKQIMSNICGELDYTEEEELVYGADYISVNSDTECIDIDIISETNDFGDGTTLHSANKFSNRECEVIHIAKRIKKIIESEYVLYSAKDKKQRNARYGDIAVLFRTPSDYVSAVEKIFGEFKIPYTSDVSGEFFGSEEIEFLLSLLRIIDNPDDDISLVTVLKNKIFGFDENELLTVRLKLKKSSFYKCIKNYIFTNDDQISNRLSDFIKKLDEYHHKSKYTDVADLIYYILDNLNYYAFLGAFPDYNIKKNNIAVLINKAIIFEKDKFKGVSNFIRYIDTVKQSKKDIDTKSVRDEDNLVRIMSIHKSKGLEFPIVILSGTGKNYNTRDSQGTVLLHKDLGIGLDAVYFEDGYKIPTSNKLAIKQKIKYELMSEELRVLYVALTRPTEKLIITGTLPNAASILTSVQNSLSFQKYKISPYLIMKSKCLLETILLSVMRSEGFESSSTSSVNINDNSVKYNVSTLNMCDILIESSVNESLDWKLKFDGVTDNYSNIINNFKYKYPYSESCNIPGNLSVTEVKKIRNNDLDDHSDIVLQRPTQFAVLSEKSGAAFGTLMHLFMENLDYTDIKDISDINKQIDNLENRGVISSEEACLIDKEAVLTFVKSDIGERIKSHYSTFRREISFKYLENARDVLGESVDDKIIIQGTIDAFFEDDDGSLVIIDYKTDKIHNGDVSDIAKRYRVQLDCYSNALEHITKKRVKEKILYLFVNDETVIM